jgi:hypothetical protein
MAKEEEKEEDYYKGVTFLNFQSGSEDQPTDHVMKIFAQFVIDLHKEKIRVYNNIQVGTPPPPPGGPPKK